jgi:DNA-binding transcriptional LysR family regulator
MDMMALQSLVAAVDGGSLTSAARRLGVTQSAISQRLSLLEKALGQQLLVRSRKGVRPTMAGSIAYEHGRQVLAGMDRMRTALDGLRGEVSGRLRITANVLLSQTVMGPLITQLMAQHPGLRIELIADDAILDIEARGIDIAVRAGGPGKSGGKVQRIGTLDAVLVAAPGYLDTVGRPKGPEDLVRLSYIQYREDPEENEIAIEHGGTRMQAAVRPAFSAQHPDLTLHAVLNGLGFAKAPRFYAQPYLDSGALAEVLPGYAPPGKPIYFVQLDHIRQSPAGQAFRQALYGHLDAIAGFTMIGRV